MGNACPHRAGAKAEASITAADVRANGWLVIFGKVYNVKDYMVKHPGGQDILLGVLGGDATVEFETMRHSQLAQKQLEQLFVGRYAAPAEPGESMAESQARERVTLTGGRASSRDGISESDPQWWDVKGRGFLPAADPVKELPRPWDCLGQLTEFIPSFAVQARFRELAETELRPRLPSSYKETRQAIASLSDGELEALHSILGYVCLAYVHAPPEIYEQDAENLVNIMARTSQLASLPEWLSRPWICVSEKLERRPMLDYAGCVLNNWERIDPRGPLVPSNVRLLRRFTGLVDEEWFFKTHIIIEAEGSHVVSSLESIRCSVEKQEVVGLLEELRSLEENLWRLSSVCLPIMFARSPQDHTLLCEPFLFFFRLRNYIKSIDVKMKAETDELMDFHLHGPSGAMSSILPAVDALLGIRNTSVELREAVKKFEDYVPKEHRCFLEKLRNARHSVKSFIETKRESIDESTWFALAAAYNSCISRVLDFRWRHWSFVEQFIVRPSSSKTAGANGASVCPVVGREGTCPVNGTNGHAVNGRAPVVGTGGTTFDYLQQHITDSQMARIPLGVAEALLMKTPEVVKMLHVPQVPVMSLEGSLLWDPTGSNGFVTARRARLPGWGPFMEAPHEGGKALLQLVSAIPTFCYTIPGLEHLEDAGTHPFVSKCEGARGALQQLIRPSEAGTAAERMSLEDLEHTWLLLVFVASAYRSSTRTPRQKELAGGPLSTLPEWLAEVVRHLEVLVGRPWSGAPEYHELVLNNWQSLEELPVDFILSRETIHLVQPVARFLATPDEEWYRKLHLVLEAEGGRAICTAQAALAPAITQRDTGAVIAALNQLAADVESLSDFQMRQFDQKDSRGEAVMMQRLRPFVAEGLSDEDYAVWVYTEGSSPLLPALHALLGLRQLDGISGPLQEHWQQGRPRMPQNHRNFLDRLEQGVSIRAYCLCAWRHASVEGIAALEDAFNNCIEALLKYCSLRQRLVSRLFPNVSRIRRMSAEQEQVIRRGRLALLQMRRVADAQRMLLSESL